MTRSPAARVLLILGVLGSLCVSDNVGFRLLPLPGAVAAVAADRQVLEGTFVTPAPSRRNTAVAREAMAPPVRKEAGGGRRTLHVTAGMAGGLVRPPVEVPSPAWTTYSPAQQSSATVTRPPGRAPPPSV